MTLPCTRTCEAALPPLIVLTDGCTIYDQGNSVRRRLCLHHFQDTGRALVQPLLHKSPRFHRIIGGGLWSTKAAAWIGEQIIQFCLWATQQGTDGIKIRLTSLGSSTFLNHPKLLAAKSSASAPRQIKGLRRQSKTPSSSR